MRSYAAQQILQEIWDDTESLDYCVEVGVIDGLDYYCNTHNQGWFWADSRPNGGGFAQHFPGSQVTLGTSLPVQIQRNGSSSWNVYGGDSFHQIGTSSRSPNTMYYQAGGSEHTLNSGSGLRSDGHVWENLSIKIQATLSKDLPRIRRGDRPGEAASARARYPRPARTMSIASSADVKVAGAVIEWPPFPLPLAVFRSQVRGYRTGTTVLGSTERRCENYLRAGSRARASWDPWTARASARSFSGWPRGP